MEKIELKKGLYRGLVAETARKLGKKQPNVYAAIFYDEKPNKEKELFASLKIERDQKRAAFDQAISKVS